MSCFLLSTVGKASFTQHNKTTQGSYKVREIKILTIPALVFLDSHPNTKSIGRLTWGKIVVMRDNHLSKTGRVHPRLETKRKLKPNLRGVCGARSAGRTPDQPKK